MDKTKITLLLLLLNIPLLFIFKILFIAISDEYSIMDFVKELMNLIGYAFGFLLIGFWIVIGFFEIFQYFFNKDKEYYSSEIFNSFIILILIGCGYIWYDFYLQIFH